MKDKTSLIQKLNLQLGLIGNENLNSDNRLKGWTKYEMTRPSGRTYGYDYILGTIEMWLGSDSEDTRYTILHLTFEKPEIENLEFFELINLLREDWSWNSYISIYSTNYEKIIHINDFGYYWKNF